MYAYIYIYIYTYINIYTHILRTSPETSSPQRPAHFPTPEAGRANSNSNSDSNSESNSNTNTNTNSNSNSNSNLRDAERKSLERTKKPSIQPLGASSIERPAIEFAPRGWMSGFVVRFKDFRLAYSDSGFDRSLFERAMVRRTCYGSPP